MLGKKIRGSKQKQEQTKHQEAQVPIAYIQKRVHVNSSNDSDHQFIFTILVGD